MSLEEIDMPGGVLKNLTVGMRVALCEGPWTKHPASAVNLERVPGHYGKVVEVIEYPDDEQQLAVEFTGHRDGGPVDPALQVRQYFASELVVID